MAPGVHDPEQELLVETSQQKVFPPALLVMEALASLRETASEGAAPPASLIWSELTMTPDNFTVASGMPPLDSVSVTDGTRIPVTARPNRIGVQASSALAN